MSTTPESSATSPSRPSGHWLAELLRRSGLPHASTLHIPRSASLADAWTQAGRTLGLEEGPLARAVAQACKLEVADLGSADSRAIKLLSQKVARQYGVLPLRQDDRNLWVATADPTDRKSVV